MKEYPANKARSEGKHAGGALCIFKRALKTTAKYQQNKNFVEFGGGFFADPLKIAGRH